MRLQRLKCEEGADIVLKGCRKLLIEQPVRYAERKISSPYASRAYLAEVSYKAQLNPENFIELGSTSRQLLIWDARLASYQRNDNSGRRK